MSTPLIPEQRRESIVEHLQRERVLSYRQLTELLGVSQMTVRRDVAALRVGPSTEVVHQGHPLVYLRGGSHLVAVNPTRQAVHVDLTVDPGRTRGARLLLGEGANLADGRLRVAGFGHGVWELS